jgi:hypothetical protein
MISARPALELGVVGGRPPVLEVAALVELAALVVEAVRDLVADRRRADVAVHQRVVDLRVGDAGQDEHRRRHDDLVVRRAVVGVVRLRRHLPLLPVDRLVELGDVVVGLPDAAAHDVQQEGVAADLVARSSPSSDRGSRPSSSRCELGEGALSRRLAHPVELARRVRNASKIASLIFS